MRSSAGRKRAGTRRIRHEGWEGVQDEIDGSMKWVYSVDDLFFADCCQIDPQLFRLLVKVTAF